MSTREKGSGKGTERRKRSNLRVTRLPGRIITAQTRREIPCEAVDVSAAGLGLSTTENLLPETDALLVTGKAEIALSLIWCSIADRNESIYRYGFRAKNPGINLAEMFIAMGCVDIKVLLVDDKPELAYFYSHVLQTSGYDVTIANCGNDAISIMNETDINIIISDILMPNGNGIEVANEARANQIPVVLVSGHSESYREVIPPGIIVLQKSIQDFGNLPNIITSLCSKAA